MKTKSILWISVITILICYMIPTTLCAEDIQIPNGTDLKRAFDMGCSFALVKVVEKLPQENRLYRIRFNVKKLYIPGDLSLNRLRKPIDTLASSTYTDKLIVGHTYALFILWDIPYGLSWAFLDNVYDLDTTSQEQMDSLFSLVEHTYKNSAVCRFRNTKPNQKTAIPNLDVELLDICKRFKDNPRNRATYARSIWKSDLGSHYPVDSNSSNIVYEIPKTKLSRGQIIRLFGQPALKCGFTYYWYCGVENNPIMEILEGPVMVVDPSQKYYGVLTVTFDADEKTRYLRYTVGNKKWSEMLLTGLRRTERIHAIYD